MRGVLVLVVLLLIPGTAFGAECRSKIPTRAPTDGLFVIRVYAEKPVTVKYEARTVTGRLALLGTSTSNGTGWKRIAIGPDLWLAQGDARLTVSWGACRKTVLVRRGIVA